VSVQDASTTACSNTVSGQTATITVNSLPTPTITGTSTLCEGSTGIIYSTQSGMSNYVWTVSSGGAISSGSTTNSITVDWSLTSAGTQTVSVNYQNTNGCTAANPTVYNVVVKATPKIPTVTNYAACPKKGTLSLSTLVSTTTGNTIKWYDDETTTITTTAKTISTLTPGTTMQFVSAISPNGCESARDTAIAVVYENPDIINVDLTDLHDVQLLAERGKSPYSYEINTDVRVTKTGDFYGVVGLGMLSFGTHTFYLTDDNGCKADTTFNIDPIPLVPDKFFTPNVDNSNSVWNITNIEFYPRTEIFIHDRYGKELIRYKGLDFHGWDGMYKGNPMPTTDYWYVIEVRETGKRLVGHFLLKR
jgi:gliding motility-associated-like protein